MAATVLTRPARARLRLPHDVRLFLGVYAGAWALTLFAAAAVARVAPLHALAAGQLHLKLYPHSRPSVGNVGGLWLHNMARTCWPWLATLGGFAAARWRRTLVDAALVASLLVNTTLVGAAIGLGGWRITAWLPHLPLEWAALALAACTWLLARRGARGRPLLVALAGVAALLAAAAALETYAVPHLT